MKKIFLMFLFFIFVSNVTYSSQDKPAEAEIVFDVYVSGFKIIYLHEKKNDLRSIIEFKINGNSDYSFFLSNVTGYSFEKSYMLMTPHPLMNIYMSAELIGIDHISLFAITMPDCYPSMDFKCTIYVKLRK